MTKDEVLGRKSRPSQVSYADGSKFTGAVFLYMLLGLIVTGVIATIMGVVFEKLLFTADPGSFSEAYSTTLIVSLILYIPTLIWVEIAASRNSKSMVPAYVVYTITMGIFLSTFTNFIPFYEIAIAFGGTCLAFALMALIAWFSKKSVSVFAVIGSGLLFGALMLTSVILILRLCNVNVTTVTWLVSYIFFIAIMLITIVDLRNVKDIAARGGAGNNIALLCALTLYVDFVYIFIRLLALVIRLRK